MRAIHSNQSFRTGSPLEAHFGLGGHEQIDLEVRLPGRESACIEALAVDRIFVVDLGAATTSR